MTKLSEHGVENHMKAYVVALGRNRRRCRGLESLIRRTICRPRLLKQHKVTTYNRVSEALGMLPLMVYTCDKLGGRHDKAAALHTAMTCLERASFPMN